jgi:hypothetical protein
MNYMKSVRMASRPNEVEAGVDTEVPLLAVLGCCS